jgi:hypothetical protein
MSVKKSYSSEYVGGILGLPIQGIGGIVFQKNGNIRMGKVAKKKTRKNVLKHK